MLPEAARTTARLVSPPTLEVRHGVGHTLASELWDVHSMRAPQQFGAINNGLRTALCYQVPSTLFAHTHHPAASSRPSVVFFHEQRFALLSVVCRSPQYFLVARFHVCFLGLFSGKSVVLFARYCLRKQLQGMMDAKKQIMCHLLLTS